jgi:hypothetical protein
MAQGRRAWKADEELAELGPVGFDMLAAPAGLDSGYLPSRDDQSWREMEALRIAFAYDEDTADRAADQDLDPQDDVLEPESTGRGQGGVIFLMVAAAALVIAALALPDILTSDFWRAHGVAATAKPAAEPARVANIPAPPLERLPPPQSQFAPASGPDLNTAPAANAMPEAVPTPRPVLRASEGDDRVARRSGTMVISPDGTVKYENGSKPAPAKRASQRQDRGAGGIYAMAPGPDGVLRYQYFPSTR